MRISERDPHEYYSGEQLGTTSVFTEKTLAAQRCSGRGPVFTKVGRLVRYQGRHILEYLESRRFTSTSEVSDERRLA